jgi:hypothetical protein
MPNCQRAMSTGSTALPIRGDASTLSDDFYVL